MEMEKKILCFIGFIVGSFIALIIVGLIKLNSKDSDTIQDYDPIVFLEKAESYEGKRETSFKVFKVLSDVALAKEVSHKESGRYFGKTVLIYGKYFYNDQVVTVRNPQIVGTYRYTTIRDLDVTVPIIKGKME